MRVEPYLSFDGRCEEALDLYKRALGAEVTMLVRFKDTPQSASTPPGGEDKVAHASVRVGDTVFMASDGQCGGNTRFHGICMSLSVANEAEADRVFEGLSEGGKVQMPLAKTFFSPRFGMLEDRFGLGWMVITQAR